MTPYIDQLYQKKFGIYSTGFDRFILVDDKDIWIMLETAELLSSKLSTVVYVLPLESKEITNENCTGYSLNNKTSHKTGSTSLLFSAMIPSVRNLSGSPFVKKENTVPQNISKFVEFVYVHTFAINLTESITRYDENSKFAKKYLEAEWFKDLKLTTTRDDLTEDLYFYLRKTLYLSQTIDEAEEKINQLWFDNSADQKHARDLYYKIINKEQPIDFNQIKSIPGKYTVYAG